MRDAVSVKAPRAVVVMGMAWDTGGAMTSANSFPRPQVLLLQLCAQNATFLAAPVSLGAVVWPRRERVPTCRLRAIS